MSIVLRRGWWMPVALAVIAVGIYLLRGPLVAIPLQPSSSSAVAQPVGNLPNMPDKPQPQAYPFDGCPPQGKGGDVELNLLKNRVDRGDYLPVSLDSLTRLTWPKNAELTPMQAWPVASHDFIDQYEGTPVQVTGYVVNLREGFPDAANCGWTNGSFLDWRLSLADDPKGDRSQAVIASVTARVRAAHNWNVDLIHSLLVDNHMLARISGWLYFDPEHPAEVGVTRATLWEIRPVMQIEIFADGRWANLDKFGR